MMCSILYNLQFEELFMRISTGDVIPLSQARATLSELADQVKAGAEKIITKNGESYVALIDARRLDYYHQLERERIHLLLIDDAAKGVADVAEGNVKDARSTLSAVKRRRAAKAAG
jgi:prevent-host-death family protein